MKVPIIIIDKEKEKLGELTGSEIDSDLTVPFEFKRLSFQGFWVDTDDNTIVFYVGNSSFRTYYNENILRIFRELIKNE